MRQRSALLQLQMVLALTLTLVLVLTLALAPSGMISKKGVPEFCPSTVLLLLLLLLLLAEDLVEAQGKQQAQERQRVGSPSSVESPNPKIQIQKSIKIPLQIHSQTHILIYFWPHIIKASP